MKKTLLIFALIASSLIFAQNDKAFVDALLAQKLAELEMQGNPLYFYKMDYCDGNVQSFTLHDGTLCTSKSTYYAVYVFWKEDDNNMQFQKFDNCGSFMPFSISFNRTVNNILEDKQALKTEKVKPYNGTASDEFCHREYKFVFSGQEFIKKYKESDLDKESKNQNSKYNNALKLVKLDVEISKQLKILEENGKFFREK